MAADDDIARALPEPPPPRPARREATIAESLRRFDAGDAGSPTAPAAPPKRSRIRRPQFAVLVSAALVAVIAVPVTVRSLSGGPSSVDRETPLMSTTEMATPALREVRTPVPITAPATSLRDTARPAAAEKSLATGARAAIAPPPAAPRAEESAPLRPAAVAQAPPAAFAAAPPPPPLPSPPPAMMATADAAEANDIVVTGQRRAAPLHPSGRVAWTDCTVDDAARSLSACKRQVDPAAAGPAGRVAALLADGLSLAWQGDTDGAITAFDRAIVLAPRSASAHLNRGLAYRRLGDLDHALADLDAAVRFDRGAARGYYARGLVRRERGDLRGADADLTRAASLDTR